LGTRRTRWQNRPQFQRQNSEGNLENVNLRDFNYLSGK
jgi:hypothetical protein